MDWVVPVILALCAILPVAIGLAGNSWGKTKGNSSVSAPAHRSAVAQDVAQPEYRPR